MNTILIPERFGCGLKLDFSELVALRRDLDRPFGVDAAVIEGVRPEMLSSIDRVFQVGAKPLHFCRLALRHAAADLIASGAEPRFVAASFEFGQELDVEGRSALTSAFFAAARERSVQVGKCHSSTAPVTGLTLVVEGPIVARLRPLPTKGVIALAGILGGLERLYRLALEGSSAAIDTVKGFNPNQAGLLSVVPELCFATDVSGYGLAGALWEFALSGPLRVELDRESLSALTLVEEASIPPCLCASLGDFGLPELDNRLQALVSRREFCGPYILGYAERDADTVTTMLSQRNIPMTVLGRFQAGPSKVGIGS